jgi:branched-chain amino acid transport system substrate-binding protein
MLSGRWAIFGLTLLALMLWFVQPAEARKKKEILIGTNLPLTGILAGVGVEQRWAYQTAVDDVNKAGGIWVEEFGKRMPVRLVVADDASDPGKAAAAVERLIKVKKVDLLLGGFAAPFGVIPGCITAEKYRRYYHTSICLIPPWLEHNFKWSTLFFFDLVQACSVPYEIWNSLPAAERPKKPALIMEDTFDGRAFAGIFRGEIRLCVRSGRTLGRRRKRLLRPDHQGQVQGHRRHLDFRVRRRLHYLCTPDEGK